MVGLNANKCSASSLLEVVVALVITLVVFGIGMMVYLNITRSSFSQQHVQAHLLLNELSNQTLSKHSYFDEVIQQEDWTIYKRITNYKNTNDLVVLEWEVYNTSNQKLASRKQLINVSEDE